MNQELLDTIATLSNEMEDIRGKLVYHDYTTEKRARLIERHYKLLDTVIFLGDTAYGRDNK